MVLPTEPTAAQAVTLVATEPLLFRRARGRAHRGGPNPGGRVRRVGRGARGRAHGRGPGSGRRHRRDRRRPADDGVIFSDTAGSDELCYSIDFDGSQTAGDGTDFIITFNVSGIFTLT